MSDWNNRFTYLIRQSRPNLWGNWALAPNIQPGAVGFVDTSSGAFKLVGETVPSLSVKEKLVSSRWKLSSEGVSRQQADVKGEVSVVDPHTGLSIKPEIEFVWRFQNKDSIASEFAIAKEVVVTDLGILNDQYAWLLAAAEKVGFAQNGKIAQGFGVITEVVYARSGLNIGANDKEASYTLGGTVKGLHALLGEKGPGGSVSASYSYSRETRSLDKHVWPATEGEVASELIPIAFAFSSFEGRTVLPAWRGRINGLSLFLDSKASKGTTYITKAKLSYNVDGKRVNEPVTTISGGLSGSFANIPVNAQELQLELVFKGVFKDVRQTLSWAVPIAQWPAGVMHIDLTGTWPGQPKATIREDLNTGL